MEGRREEERKVEVEKGRGVMGKEKQEGEEKKSRRKEQEENQEEELRETVAFTGHKCSNKQEVDGLINC